MSLIFATQLTAVATAVLAVFAIVTAVFALLAFRKQSREVGAIEKQVTDQETLTKQQAELLEIQGRQLDLQQKQFDQQAGERRRAQASRVFMWTEFGVYPRATKAQRASGDGQLKAVTVYIKNTSEQPVYDVVIGWHKGTAPGGTRRDSRPPARRAGRQDAYPRPGPAQQRGPDPLRRGPPLPRRCRSALAAPSRRSAH
jgi:hypothetical protein